jgi:hypothetical protein
MKHPRWTTALLAVLIADSLITIYIGEEASPIILWVMGALRINLREAMALRIIYLAPLVAVVDRYYRPGVVLFCYLALYFLGGLITWS